MLSLINDFYRSDFGNQVDCKHLSTCLSAQLAHRFLEGGGASDTCLHPSPNACRPAGMELTFSNCSGVFGGDSFSYKALPAP